MTALSRNKGKAFEQLCARMLTEATGSSWRRRVRQHDQDSDIVPGDGCFAHLSIECKHATALRLPEWWRQACMQAGPGSIPVLIYRQTGGPIRVQIDAYNANPEIWPEPNRYTVTLEWEPAMQWLREQARNP